MSDTKGIRRRVAKQPEPVPAVENVPLDDSGKTEKPIGGQVYEKPSEFDLGDILIQHRAHVTGLIYTALSLWTRFHRIGHSNKVVWDEAHFGKFGSHYLKREFYFDVHPPLGKMIVGFVGLLAGYDGSYEFKSGEEYPENVPFVAMRMMLALFGVGMVPLAWYTGIELGLSEWACHLFALMVLLDLGWLCISRFILLDSMLLFFTVLTVFCLTKFNNQQSRPFSFGWWTWLSMTGISIGCATSVKMIGLFVTSLVGLYTIEDLWNKFGDVQMPVRTQIKHWVARVYCLIVIPIIVFMASFKLHFLVLNESGPGDSQMSSLFQANLQGSELATYPIEVAFGSRITLKAMGFGGGLLHSHAHVYPEGSGQQQITCYHHKDNNNEFTILPRWDEPPIDESQPIRYLTHGDIIRLNHDMTTRNLHSHSVPAPITKLHHEVSCYGNSTIGDMHDYWVVEVLDDYILGGQAKVPRVRTLTTRLRFRHEVLGCYLFADNTNLPQWGWKQIEVSCMPDSDAKDIRTHWNVEGHWNQRLPPGDKSNFKTSFLRDFVALNVAMMNSNNALIPDPDKQDILASKPLDWPFLHLGLRMCGWGDDDVKYYLLGNPIVWWGGGISLIASFVTLVAYLMRMQRQYFVMGDVEWNHFLYVSKIAGFGWALHYIPFMVMGRVTYVHHYLPTLYFAVLMFVHMLDHFIFSSPRFNATARAITFGIVASAVIATFWWFKGIAFGIDGPIREHWGLSWRNTWNIYNQ
ncbi:Glycosyltransferase family 39 protein [Mycena indigotica]|uniref:Dolichyl-phosphate-mannose--protein mannosyltransferase n=1 Tax=Mycena indigotica TaxID=2126181 RepID=A0A8H6VVK5_9AGAR|nr:Glycosyltransferase family 39 protein [Mycena indigotica]KAF7295574.1 Glycosyltransferase family 39 protein [Mycena indigotica]